MAEFPYPPNYYDEKFHLRISPLLWLVVVWSVHPLLLLTLGAFSNSGEVARSVGSYASNAASVLSSVPGALVLLARMYRLPDAGNRVRWIWRNGRLLLAAGLIMQFVAVLFVHRKQVADLNEAMLASLFVSAGLFIALLASRYSRDLFADFPSVESATKD